MLPREGEGFVSTCQWFLGSTPVSAIMPFSWVAGRIPSRRADDDEGRDIDKGRGCSSGNLMEDLERRQPVTDDSDRAQPGHSCAWTKCTVAVRIQSWASATHLLSKRGNTLVESLSFHPLHSPVVLGCHGAIGFRGSELVIIQMADDRRHPKDCAAL